MKVSSIDFNELMKKFTVNLIKMQEYLEDQKLYLSPRIKDCINSLVPCKSNVLYGADCKKCKICSNRESW